ncbi:hypothetical protein NDU88_006478, partial [Pleurodeles waltl]
TSHTSIAPGVMLQSTASCVHDTAALVKALSGLLVVTGQPLRRKSSNGKMPPIIAKVIGNPPKILENIEWM